MAAPGSSAPRLLVIGIDCASPDLLFHADHLQLPTLRGLLRSSIWGPLRSCDPPITVPAWSCLTTGHDPDALGLYGFRKRVGTGYHDFRTVTSRDVQLPRVWDIIGHHGKKSIVVGVPQTYPPSPINGCLVTGPLTPENPSACTYPRSLRSEIETAVGPLKFDIPDYRARSKEDLLPDLIALMEHRFAVTRYLMQHKPWDFCMMVDIATDRLHHTFWTALDPNHPEYEDATDWHEGARQFYTRLDQQVALLIEAAGPDTNVMIASDHGAQPMLGGFCINDWLIDQGLLALRDTPAPGTPLQEANVDWSNTHAWAHGGYCARIYLNIEGREPQGIIPPEDVKGFCEGLDHALHDLTDPLGYPLETTLMYPDMGDSAVPGCDLAPDLLLYLGQLAWRAIGSLGHPERFIFDNDTGTDEANHALHGVFIYHRANQPVESQRDELLLRDVAPTILATLGLPKPKDMPGAPVQ